MVPGKGLLADGYFSLDVLTLHPGTGSEKFTLRVGEIKVYPDRGGFTDAHELAGARAQAGLYVYALRSELERWGLEIRRLMLRTTASLCCPNRGRIRSLFDRAKTCRREGLAEGVAREGTGLTGGVDRRNAGDSCSGPAGRPRCLGMSLWRDGNWLSSTNTAIAEPSPASATPTMPTAGSSCPSCAPPTGQPVCPGREELLLAAVSQRLHRLLPMGT